ncbi:UPF0187-domain-containing protein [Hymenopellis radicata]|nr:UPF0187-domain-containing protein [Hymenopellis radicata]
MAQRPAYNLVAWTFGRGSVIWRIWPAVLLHTLFAALVVYLDLSNSLRLQIPNVMLTVLGVVIGFVISYQKRMALDLIDGFAVALKHHLRGEIGIYYEDLYDLIRPLHEHDHTVEQQTAAMTTAMPPPSRAHRIASNPSLPKSAPSPTPSPGASRLRNDNLSAPHPVIPPINAYGTFQHPTKVSSSSLRQLHRTPSQTSVHSVHSPLQAARQTPRDDMLNKVSGDLIPFAGVYNAIRGWFTGKRKDSDSLPTSEEPIRKDPFALDSSQICWRAPVHPGIGSNKHRPLVAGFGENLPLEILRCLSEWYSVLEDRNTVPGTSLGSMIGLLAAMEETLSAMERILTTPLPFVYSVHIRHTVWLYLFFLPFQLVTNFQWYTVGGVCIASFIYLGFLAAGEEIEQPFGYDENDLDLDMFCQEIIHVDIERLKKSPCLNAYLEPQHHARIRSMTLTEVISAGDDSDTSEPDDAYNGFAANPPSPATNTMLSNATKTVLRNVPRAQMAASTRFTSTRLYSSTMHDNDPVVLETEKMRNLSSVQHKTSTPHSHAPGWNEHLATASEASIKADRAEGTGTPLEMQSRTVEYIQARHSPEDRVAPTAAMYSKDIVDGPLGSASGVEDTGGPQELVKKTVRQETTEFYKKQAPTASEANVKADRGEV